MKRRTAIPFRLVAVLLSAVLVVAACESADEGQADSTPAESAVGSLQSEPTVTETAADPAPAVGRLVSMAISDGPVGFEVSYARTRELGIDATELSVSWDELEPAPGVFGADPDYLAIADSYYPGQGVSIGLSIAVLDTNQDRRPEDLRGLTFDDPLVIERFNALLDYVAQSTSNLEITSLSLGNEVDVWLQANGQWDAYDRFFEAVSAHARTRFPDVPIGVKTTMSGYWANPSAVAALHDTADAVFLTHYLIGQDFAAQPPQTVHDVFADAVAMHPDKPVRFLELGAPSDPLIGGSEADQAAFVGATFEAWDAHADQIDQVVFTWSTDIGNSAVEVYYSYYGLSDDRFGAYLGSIGFLTEDGEPKAAYGRLQEEIASRSL